MKNCSSCTFWYKKSLIQNFTLILPWYSLQPSTSTFLHPEQLKWLKWYLIFLISIISDPNAFLHLPHTSVPSFSLSKQPRWGSSMRNGDDGNVKLIRNEFQFHFELILSLNLCMSFRCPPWILDQVHVYSNHM